MCVTWSCCCLWIVSMSRKTRSGLIQALALETLITDGWSVGFTFLGWFRHPGLEHRSQIWALPPLQHLLPASSDS